MLPTLTGSDDAAERLAADGAHIKHAGSSRTATRATGAGPCDGVIAAHLLLVVPARIIADLEWAGLGRPN